MLYGIIVVLFIVIVALIYYLIYQKNKSSQELLNNRKELIRTIDKNKYYIKENTELKKIIMKYEDDIYSKIDTFDVCGGKVKKEPIYKGKKALIGDYLPISYFNTENVLRSLGFCVDIVPTVEDVVNKIRYGEHYDIIFTNKVYEHGSGEDCLKQLRELKDFNIPIVLHTATKGERDFFVNEIGFNEYIEKPITQENVKIILKRILKQ